MHFTNLRPPHMAVAVDHHRSPFKPASCNRRRRLLSFPHLDLNQLDLLPPNPFRSPKPSPVTAPPTFHRSLSTPCLSSGKSDMVDSPDNSTRMEIVMGKRALGVNALVVEAAIAMASGVRPVPVPCGVDGVYYLLNRAGENLAVLKPVNDEPTGLALGQPGIRRSISVGETGVREVAAYLLDHGGFSSVPPTALVKISDAAFQPTSPPSVPRHRIASIQRFVPHNFDAGDLGPSRFSISSVHRIGILDIRLLNIDRHSGNILVKSCISSMEDVNGAAELVPIDHGLCLPELLDDPYFEWLHWPQATVPFSDVELDYISSLEPSKDADLLRAELPLLREPSIRILTLCSTFLKCAAAAGLCLADIGDMMTRRFCGTDGSSCSTLEDICRQVDQSMASVEFEVSHDGTGSPQDEGNNFQFDVEFDNSEVEYEQVCVDIPTLLRTLSPKPLPTKSLLFRSMSSKAMLLCSVDTENGNDNCGSNSNEEISGEEEEETRFVGSLTKSMSFVVSDPSHHGKCLSFKGLTDEEWSDFLERFEELLPEVFEERKNLNLGVMKQRLGSFCKF